MGGPLVFFSGGTALRDLAAELAMQRVPSVHLITTFDSGGSSGVLRSTLRLPAVGDLRARLLSLAPASLPERPLLERRLPDSGVAAARAELRALLGRVEAPYGMAQHRWCCIRRLLISCAHRFPPETDLRNACIGNLVLAERCLRGGSLAAAVDFFGRFIGAFGAVRPVTEACADLRVRLANGVEIVGQHRFTGKFFSPIESPIRHISLTVPASAPLCVLEDILNAGIICYPVGSFYSSLLAALLPSGIRWALEKLTVPRVFMPNPLPDPELCGQTLLEQVDVLRGHAPVTHLLADPDDRRYPGGVPELALKDRGIIPVRLPILRGNGRLNPRAVIDALTRLRDGS
ncbi:MAG: YvcK family protein [Deltaproteobacteria bacterium]|nr:YvcK family protein [Deltaproteobacteria bacterium]